MSHPRFIEGDINTNFIADEYPDGFLGANITSEIVENFIATAVCIHISEQKRAATISDQIIDESDRIGTRWVVKIDNQYYQVLVKMVEGGLNLRHKSTRIYLRTNWQIGSKLFSGVVNGRPVHIKIDHIRTGYVFTHGGVTVKAFVRSPRISELEAMIPERIHNDISYELNAPLTGQLL
jgi:propionyl-CoA carboxylase alpha chain